MTRPDRIVWFVGAAWAALAFVAPAAAQPAPPQITKVIVNGEANLTTADQVNVEVLYNHPAAPGMPIPFYRLRVKPPNRGLPQWGSFVEAGERNVFVAVLTPRGMTPVGGTYEIQVQLRDADGRESNVAGGHVIRASPTPTVIPGVEYRVSGSEVAELIGFARLEGYLNTAEPLNGTSNCSSKQNDGHWHLRMQKLVVPVPLGTEAAPAPRCRFGFFKGKLLQYGWHLKSAALESWSQEPATWVIENAIKATGLDAWFSIAGAATGAMGSGEIRLRELVLEGPPGSDWRKAFRQ